MVNSIDHTWTAVVGRQDDEGVIVESWEREQENRSRVGVRENLSEKKKKRGSMACVTAPLFFRAWVQFFTPSSAALSMP
jgi:hypothetical protein